MTHNFHSYMIITITIIADWIKTIDNYFTMDIIYSASWFILYTHTQTHTYTHMYVCTYIYFVMIWGFWMFMSRLGNGSDRVDLGYGLLWRASWCSIEDCTYFCFINMCLVTSFIEGLSINVPSIYPYMFSYLM